MAVLGEEKDPWKIGWFYYSSFLPLYEERAYRCSADIFSLSSALLRTYYHMRKCLFHSLICTYIDYLKRLSWWSMLIYITNITISVDFMQFYEGLGLMKLVHINKIFIISTARRSPSLSDCGFQYWSVNIRKFTCKNMFTRKENGIARVR